MTTEDPLVPRTAATVMLIRDTADGIKVFLMRRHSAMDFVAGVMVFPGGGVDDRDRNADVAWFGPEPGWWAERFGVEPDLAEALVCAAARETFEESGVLFAGPADDPDAIVGDASIYGGGNVGNDGGAESEPVAAHGFPQSIRLTVPPLGCLYLKRRT